MNRDSLRGFLFGISVSVAFILGCVASNTVVRDADAKSGDRAYYCFSENDGSLIETRASELGSEGWKMIAAAGNESWKTWCFERRR